MENKKKFLGEKIEILVIRKWLLLRWYLLFKDLLEFFYVNNNYIYLK